MQVVQYKEFSADSIDGIVLTETPKPENPQSGHVVIKIHAASLNPCDLMVSIFYIFENDIFNMFSLSLRFSLDSSWKIHSNVVVSTSIYPWI